MKLIVMVLPDSLPDLISYSESLALTGVESSTSSGSLSSVSVPRD